MPILEKSIEELKGMKDKDIDFSDIPELDANFWKDAKLIRTKTKKAISLRLDQDVLNYFKSQGKGYQSLINDVLKTYVQAQSI